MAAPPLLDGAVQVTVPVVDVLAVPVPMVGAPGTVLAGAVIVVEAIGT